MKKSHTPRSRRRAYESPALFSAGFRPLFLLAGISAVVGLALSVGMIAGAFALPTAIDPVSWHVHEMIFGFVAAAIGGFLLTATANWTGRLPVQGPPLIGLCLLWLVGRLAMATSAIIGALPAALIELSYLAVLIAFAGREIIAGRNWRNSPIILILTILLATDILWQIEILELANFDGAARRLAIATVLTLIMLIGGRVIPSFTRNWLAKRDAELLPASFGVFDKIVLAVTVPTLIGWAVAPETRVVGGFLLLASFLNLARLIRWQGHRTASDALVWVLHVGYFWIPVGLFLLAANALMEGPTQAGGIHALTAGAIATMILAVMSRATLGHTGRKLHAGTGLSIAYILVSAGTLARVLGAYIEAFYSPLLIAGAFAWALAFILFTAICGPMMLTRRRRK
ncbi:MAG: NnrS family protein [Alphaproteobacteria bacterium]|nr:NnrS family protein [Alphaproteobacteria bacterium]